MRTLKASVSVLLVVAGLVLLAPLPVGAQTMSFRMTGSMQAPRAFHTATLLPSGKVLVAGGYDCSASPPILASAELYDPLTEAWTSTGSLNVARFHHTATLLPDGKVLVTSGNSSPGWCGEPEPSHFLASAEVYDPLTGTWSLTGSMSVPRWGSTATLLPSGKALVAGGTRVDYVVSESADLYDPATGIFIPTGDLNQARRGHTATLLLDGRVLVADGGDPWGNYTSAELFDPIPGTWVYTGFLNTPFGSREAVRLTDGRVLFAGGDGAQQLPVAVAEVYDPPSGSFSPVVSLDFPRKDHSLTLLSDGRVLAVGGGSSIPGERHSSAELYDPTAGVWTAAASMHMPRCVHTATRLLSGEVLVVGGDTGPAVTNSAELYMPAAPPYAFDAFLHGSGGTANPPVLSLDSFAPTATTAKYKDSASVKFSGGNPWTPIGTWTAQPALTPGAVTTLSDLQVWLGLKNSDDQGTQFDLRAEVFKNGNAAASGETRCITSITRNPNLAKEVAVAFDSFSPVDFNGTMDVLSVHILTRIGTNPDGTKCAGPGGSHGSAVGLRLYFDAVSRPSGLGAVAP